MNQIIPIPRCPVSIRLATMEDLSFIDSLQKKHSRQLGFFPRAQMEGYLRNQWVLVAEESGSPVGYLASRDRYQKRDELGAIFQLCVSDQVQRKLVGAMLLKAVFERAPYGCKLFCCWCAQDIAANRFWEAMGFVPLAFRTGSRAKGPKGTARVHIFWQRRIREGDVTTPYWFPAQTSSGSIREDRLVLPIPPGVRWSEQMPVILPGLSGVEGPSGENPKLEDRNPKQIANRQSKTTKEAVKERQRILPGIQFDIPKAPQAPKEKPRREKKVVKNDPKLVAAARELRDRWLERVNEDPSALIGQGKYEVSKALSSNVSEVEGGRQLPVQQTRVEPTRLLPAA